MADTPNFEEFYNNEYLPLVKRLDELEDLVQRVDALESLVDRVDGLETAQTSTRSAPPEAKKGTEKVKPPTQTFKVDKKTYRFIVGQYRDLGGNLIKAADSLKNPAELERLVKIKSGIIQEA